MKYCINGNEGKLREEIYICRNCLLEEKSEDMCCALNICTGRKIIVNSEDTSPIFIL